MTMFDRIAAILADESDRDLSNPDARLLLTRRLNAEIANAVTPLIILPEEQLELMRELFPPNHVIR